MLGLFFLLGRMRRLFSMGIGLTMIVLFGLTVVGVSMIFTMDFVHSLMQHLSLLPRMLVTRHGGKNQRSDSKEGWDGFHEGVREP